MFSAVWEIHCEFAPSACVFCVSRGQKQPIMTPKQQLTCRRSHLCQVSPVVSSTFRVLTHFSPTVHYQYYKVRRARSSAGHRRMPCDVAGSPCVGFEAEETISSTSQPFLPVTAPPKSWALRTIGPQVFFSFMKRKNSSPNTFGVSED